MSEIGLTLIAVTACVGWSLFLATYVRLLDVSKHRTIKVPMAIPFAIIPLVEEPLPGFELNEVKDERPPVQ